MLIDGQVHGGVAYGIGQALYEQVVYDDRGQLVTGTFMDYGLPTANEIPSSASTPPNREPPNPALRKHPFKISPENLRPVVVREPGLACGGFLRGVHGLLPPAREER